RLWTKALGLLALALGVNPTIAQETLKLPGSPDPARLAFPEDASKADKKDAPKESPKEIQAPTIIGNVYGENYDNYNRRGQWGGGVGIYYMQPVFESNPAINTQSLIGVGPAVVANTRDFRWGWEVAPQAWIGYTNSNGLGVRFRYWQFDENSSTE